MTRTSLTARPLAWLGTWHSPCPAPRVRRRSRRDSHVLSTRAHERRPLGCDRRSMNKIYPVAGAACTGVFTGWPATGLWQWAIQADTQSCADSVSLCLTPYPLAGLGSWLILSPLTFFLVLCPGRRAPRDHGAGMPLPPDGRAGDTRPALSRELPGTINGAPGPARAGPRPRGPVHHSRMAPRGTGRSGHLTAVVPPPPPLDGGLTASSGRTARCRREHQPWPGSAAYAKTDAAACSSGDRRSGTSATGRRICRNGSVAKPGPVQQQPGPIPHPTRQTPQAAGRRPASPGQENPVTFTHGELLGAATRMLAYLVGTLLLCGIVITIAVALTVTVKERITSRCR